MQRRSAETWMTFPSFCVAAIIVLTVSLVAADAYQCGKPAIEPSLLSGKRILGGEASTAGSWPWQARIGERVAGGISFFCGGAVLNPMFILTAGHCFPGNNLVARKYVIRVAEYNMTGSENIERDYGVVMIVKHPNYTSTGSPANDVTLLRLAYPITFTDHISSVCLPEPASDPEPGSQCVVTGWGRFMDEFLPPVGSLEKVNVTAGNETQYYGTDNSSTTISPLLNATTIWSTPIVRANETSTLLPSTDSPLPSPSFRGEELTAMNSTSMWEQSSSANPAEVAVTNSTAASVFPDSSSLTYPQSSSQSSPFTTDSNFWNSTYASPETTSSSTSTTSPEPLPTAVPATSAGSTSSRKPLTPQSLSDRQLDIVYRNAEPAPVHRHTTRHSNRSTAHHIAHRTTPHAYHYHLPAKPAKPMRRMPPPIQTHSDVLQQAVVTIQDRHECNAFWKPLLRATMLCTFNKAGDPQREPCKGDSGGPLVCKHGVGPDATWRIEGIISFGAGCGGQKPAVYTRVGSYVRWIQNISRYPNPIPLASLMSLAAAANSRPSSPFDFANFANIDFSNIKL